MDSKPDFRSTFVLSMKIVRLIRYFTPVLPQEEIGQSNFSSKLPKDSCVIRSSSMRGLAVVRRQPSSMVHESPGGVSAAGSRQLRIRAIRGPSKTAASEQL